MKKKILTLCLTFLLTILFICKTIPVKASENAFTSTFIDTGITTTIPNSIKGNGIFVNLFHFLSSRQDLALFLQKVYGNEIEINGETIVIPEGMPLSSFFVYYLLAGNQTYYCIRDDDLYQPFVLYVSSEEMLNKYLRDKDYIEYGETYEDCTNYMVLYDLLQQKSELQISILEAEDIPDVYCKIVTPEVALYKGYESLFCNWYLFSETRLPYIINGTWQYKNVEYNVPIEVCKVLDLPNSIGKVTKESDNTYTYRYSEVEYSEDFGYYYLSTENEQRWFMKKEDLPSFVIDTAGNVKDVYISKNNEYWTLPEVKSVYEKVNFISYIDEEYYYTSSIAGAQTDYKLLVAYIAFVDEYGRKIPTDTIEEIELNFEMQENKSNLGEILKVLTFGKFKYKTYNCSCVLKKTGYVQRPVFPDGPLISHTTGYEDLNLQTIQKDKYVFNYEGKIYEFDYKLYLADEDKQVTNANNPFAFRTNYECINDIIHVSSIISYQSILYSLKNVDSTTINSNLDKNEKEKSLWQKFWEWIVKLWNLGIFGKILVIIIFVLLSIPCIYLLSFILKLIRKLIVNKKNKSIDH